MNATRHFLIALLALSFPIAASAQANKAAGAVAEHALSPIAKEAADQAAKGLMEQATVDAGRQAAEASSRALQESLAASAGKYGEAVTILAKRVPEASTALATRAPQLVPLAGQFGDDILRVEARAPGFAELTAKSFTKQDLPRLLKLSDQQMMTVIKLSTHATEPQAAKLLLEGAEKGGDRFLSQISSKQILASGLSVATVLAAYRAAGIFEASPAIAMNGVTRIAQSLLGPVFYVLAGLLALRGGFGIWRRHRREMASAAAAK